MARVNVTIQDELWSDWRAPALAEALGLPKVADAVGRLAWLWRWCIGQRADIAPRNVVETLLGKGGADALVACELADPVEGGLRVHGTGERIRERERWLQQRVEAGQNRAAKAGRLNGAFCKEAHRVTSETPASRQRALERETPPPNGSEAYKVTSEPPATDQRVTSESPAFLDLRSEISEISEIPPVSPPLKPPQVKTAKSKAAEPRGRSASLRSGAQAPPSPDSRREFSDEDIAIAKRVLGHVTRKTGVQYQASTAHVRLIRARLREGISEHDLRCVVGYAWDAAGLNWANSLGRDGVPMSRWLKPETLFGPSTIHRYLDGARDWYRRHVEPNLPPEERSSTEKPINGNHSPTVIAEILGKPNGPRRH